VFRRMVYIFFVTYSPLKSPSFDMCFGEIGSVVVEK
jgi:hypothetical protein